jgi:hypothetical protein
MLHLYQSMLRATQEQNMKQLNEIFDTMKLISNEFKAREDAICEHLKIEIVENKSNKYKVVKRK